MSESSRPSWKSKQATRRTSTSNRRSWEEREQRDSVQIQRFRRKMQLALFAGAVLLGLGVFAYILLSQQKRVGIIAFTVTGYDSHILPNAFAKEDRDFLGSINEEQCQFENGVEDLTAQNYKVIIQKYLKRTEQYPGPQNTVVIYLNAHGAIDGDGAARILLNGADPTDSATWLPVTELLTFLDETDDGRMKLLVLDCNRIDAQWNLGQLHNGFVDGVKRVMDKVKNVSVITAAAEDEASWALPELGNSAFGYHLTRALQGDADSDSDNKVTLDELASYLRTKVAGEVSSRRRASQRPQLLLPTGVQRSRPIIYVAKQLAEDVAVRESKSKGRIESLRTQWQDQILPKWEQYHQLFADGDPLRTNPAELAELRFHLLRSEQLWLAGSAYADEFQASLGSFSSLHDRIRQSWQRDTIRCYSLPMVMNLDNVPARKVRQDLAKAFAAAGGIPQPADPKEKEKMVPVGYAAALEAVVNNLLDNTEIGRSRLEEGLKYLNENTREKPLAHAVEAKLIELLIRDLDWNQRVQGGVLSALKSRVQAERAAASADERVQYWVRSIVDPMDRKMREAENRLFIGNVEAIERAERDWNELLGSQGYSEAIQRGQIVARLFRTRDEGWFKLPAIARWVDRQRLAGDNNQLTQMSTAIQSLRTLSEELESRIQSSDSLSGPQAEVFKTVLGAEEKLRESLDKLTSAINADGASLRTAGADGRTAEIIQWLENPLRNTDAVGSNANQDLVQQRDELVQQLLTIFQQFATVNEFTDAVSGDPPLSELAYVDKKFVHPVLEVLSHGHYKLLGQYKRALPEANDDKQDRLWRLRLLARQGEEVRQRLRLVKDGVDHMAGITDERLKSETAIANESRAGLSEADRLARSVMPILGQVPAWGDDPSNALRQVDLHYLLTWHARRAIDDMFGGTATGGGGAPSETPYFKLVAGDYGRSAQSRGTRRLVPRDRGLVLSEEVAELVKNLQQVSISAQSLTATDDSVLQQRIRLALPGRIVPGEAAMLIHDSQVQQRLVEVQDSNFNQLRRWSQPVGTPLSNTIERRIAVAAIPHSEGTNESRLQASMFYRGHWFSEGFSVKISDRPAVNEVVDRLRPDAKVVVHADASRQGRIMFILDGSFSMKGARLFEAKSALKKVLRLLARDNRYRVGLRVYGTQANYDADGELTNAPGAGGVVPKQDTVVLEPIQRRLRDNNEALLAELVSRIDNVQAFGLTPLFAAMVRSLSEDFSQAVRGEVAHIVLLTDGMDNIGYPSEDSASHAEVRAAINKLKNAGIPVQLDIIGVSLAEPGNANYKAKYRRDMDFIKSLPKSTGGEFLEADPARIFNSFEKALNLGKFTVASTVTQLETSSQIETGQFMTVKHSLGAPPAKHIVKLLFTDASPTEDIVIEGGERLELEYQENLKQLRFRKYNPLQFGEDFRGKQVRTQDPLTQVQYLVQAVKPRKTGDQVKFFVSIQNENLREFTLRPKHAWAEIQPLDQSRQPVGKAYVLSDISFLPDRPVPIFCFDTQQWPMEATYAEIKIWFKIKQSEVTEDAKLKADGGRYGAAGVEFTTSSESLDGDRGTRITVIEKRANSAGENAFRISCDRRPDIIRHVHYQGTGETKHFFEFKTATQANVLITSRSKILDGAIQAGGMIVPIEER